MNAFVRWAALGSVLGLLACGYRVTAPNADLPVTFVPLFVNRTAEPAAELVFTEAAKDQLSRAGRLGGNAAPATLRGTIAAINSGPFLSSPELGRQPVFRMNLTLALELERPPKPTQSITVSMSEEFNSGADVLLTESNRGAALKRLAESALREGLERLQTPP